MLAFLRAEPQMNTELAQTAEMFCTEEPTEGGLYAGGTKNSNSRHATASHKNTEILRA